MAVEDDGGFARREGRDDSGPAGEYFECLVQEEACEDLEPEVLKACGCKQCVAYIAHQVEMDEAARDAEDFPEVGDKCGCGDTLYKDCYGRTRCPQCDPPCPHCDDT